MMARRTIRDARESLDLMRPGLSDYQARQLAKVLDGFERQAIQATDEYAERKSQEANTLRTEALRELTLARDAYEELSRDDRATASDLSAQLADARRRQQAAEEALQRVSAMADEMESIESDPIAWYSAMQDRLPNMKVEVPW